MGCCPSLWLEPWLKGTVPAPFLLAPRRGLSQTRLLPPCASIAVLAGMSAVELSPAHLLAPAVDMGGHASVQLHLQGQAAV